MKMENLSNTEINKMIQNTFSSETERTVVRCRIIDGLTYDEIVNRYYNGEFISDRTKDTIVRTKIQPLIKKLLKEFVNMKEVKKGRNINNCPNCGAPLNKDGHCEYCGSNRQPESKIVITAESITVSCG